MELGDQFRTPDHPTLFDAPEGPPQLTEWPDVSKVASRPSAVPRPRSRHGIEVEGAGTIYPFLHPSDDVTHTQLPMLAKASEIMANYAPAEGDRMYHGTKLFVNSKVSPGGVDDPRAGEPTERPYTTDYRHNERWQHPATGLRFYKRTSERIGPSPETDEQMWERKGAENTMSPDEAFKYRMSIYEANAMATPEQLAAAKPPAGRTQSLDEHLRAGGDPGVIPLGTTPNPLGTPGSSISEMTKPMVAGGQHRIKAMHTVDPERYLPVEHWRNTFEARYMPKPGGKKGEFINRPGYT